MESQDNVDLLRGRCQVLMPQVSALHKREDRLAFWPLLRFFGAAVNAAAIPCHLPLLKIL